MAKIENYKPLGPLGIEFVNLKHAGYVGLDHNCESCKRLEGYKGLEFLELIDLPSVREPKPITNADRIESAKDVIDAIFKTFNPRIDLHECKEQAIFNALELDSTKVELKESAKIKDAVIAQIVKSLMEKLDHRVAIIRGKTDCSKVGCFCKGDQVEFFSLGNVGVDKHPELGEDAKDGEIEDLIGVIEVVGKP